MNIVIGIAIILGFLALGEVGAYLMNHFIPGSVLGMILLFIALTLKWVKPDTIRPVAKFLTQNMSIFFIPAFMGILEQWDVIRLNFVEWIIVVLFSTIAVFFSSGYVAKIIIKLTYKEGTDE